MTSNDIISFLLAHYFSLMSARKSHVLTIVNVFLCGFMMQTPFSSAHCDMKVITLKGTNKEQHTKKKTVHFIRHAQGLHNVAGEKDYFAYRNEIFYDCSLSSLGEKQCAENQVRYRPLLQNAQLVVVSPLHRTLQTACFCLPYLKPNAKWFAIESVREQTGFHPCDKRRSRSEKMAHPDFRHIDFSTLEHDEDPLYNRYTFREPESDVATRAREFFGWLGAREESEVIVVSHSAFLSSLFGHVVDCDDVDKKHYENCEVRSYIIEIPVHQ